MTTEMTTLLEQGLMPSPERDNIINMFKSGGSDDQTKKARDKAQHLLMDGVSKLRDFAFVANVLLTNVRDLRPNVYDRFVKMCEEFEHDDEDKPTSSYFNAVHLIRKNVNDPESVGKHDRGCHDLIAWAKKFREKIPEGWDVVAEEFLSSVVNLHEGVYRDLLKNSPDGDFMEDFNAELVIQLTEMLEGIDKPDITKMWWLVDILPENVRENFNAELAVQLTEMLTEVKRCDKSDIVRMHKLIDILGKTDEVKELFGKFRDNWSKFPNSVATRLGMPNDNKDDSGYSVGFASSAPAFLSNPLVKPRQTVEELEAEGWTIQRDDGRQVILEKDGDSKTVYRPKTRSSSVKRPAAKKEKKVAGKSKGNGGKK